MFMNANLFEPGKSKPERNFVQLAVKQNQRFDGRRSNECRDVELTFGADWGTVAVSLGDTKVLTHVTCDLGAPTTSRPNEGKLQLNVNLGGVAFLDEVQSTHDQRSLTLNSLLERTFRSSRCVDLESLCVAAEQHVWCIRVDINVLNHDGNLYDASTIATLAALMHFRRPDVTFADDELRIYTEKERDFIPLLFLHYPVSVTYCIFKSSAQPIVDPLLLEENAADSVIVLSFNSYQELCTLNAGGTAPTNVRTIMQCARNAATRAKSLVDFIRKALSLDEERRLQGGQLVQGLVALIGENQQKLSFRKLMGHQKQEPQDPQSEKMDVDAKAVAKPMVEEMAVEEEPSRQETDAPLDSSSWLPQDEDSQELPTPSEASASKVGKGKQNRSKSKANKKQQAKKQNHSDSEEEAKPVI
ncbi:exosome complex component RRP45 [Drosophila subpulchrella]|uniref:exosome complex component RRP45 n=1 Tax=Drosophila subpulchrella TaxID=1486046 RepID=UPI0018A1563D|nr:exosome complex component RRP45 [Drosophila subpulchrella]